MLVRRATYDESIYLHLSIQSVKEGRLAPGFMELGVAPLPAWLTYVPLLLLEGEVQPGRHVREAPPRARELIRAPRFLNSLLVGVSLVLTVFTWLHRRRGLTAATLGGGLTAMSPTIVTHGGLATTDASLALFAMLGLAAIAWCSASPGAGRLLVAAAAVAAAMTAKYSGVFLLPVAGVMFLLSSIRRHRDERWTASAPRVLRDGLHQGLVLVGLVLPLWWAGHLFARTPPPPEGGRATTSVGQSWSRRRITCTRSR